MGSGISQQLYYFKCKMIYFHWYEIGKMYNILFMHIQSLYVLMCLSRFHTVFTSLLCNEYIFQVCWSSFKRHFTVLGKLLWNAYVHETLWEPIQNSFLWFCIGPCFPFLWLCDGCFKNTDLRRNEFRLCLLLVLNTILLLNHSNNFYA